MRPTIKEIRFADIFCRQHQKMLGDSATPHPELDDTVAVLKRILKMNMRDLKATMEDEFGPFQALHAERVIKATYSSMEQSDDPHFLRLAMSIVSSFEHLLDKRLKASGRTPQSGATD